MCMVCVYACVWCVCMSMCMVCVYACVWCVYMYVYGMCMVCLCVWCVTPCDAIKSIPFYFLDYDSVDGPENTYDGE